MKPDRLGLRRLGARLNPELLVWSAGLLYLALINPAGGNHLNFCLFQFLGIDVCPGCGLGRSISFLLHGDVAASWQAHPLGSFAVVILVLRIASLVRTRRDSPRAEKTATTLQK